MVNLFPIRKPTDYPDPFLALNATFSVRYVPAWFPFANFRRIGAVWREQLLAAVNTPFDMVKADMVSHYKSLPVTLLILSGYRRQALQRPAYAHNQSRIGPLASPTITLSGQAGRSVRV